MLELKAAIAYVITSDKHEYTDSAVCGLRETYATYNAIQ
jgi:hypothetical protein